MALSCGIQAIVFLLLVSPSPRDKWAIGSHWKQSIVADHAPCTRTNAAKDSNDYAMQDAGVKRERGEPRGRCRLGRGSSRRTIMFDSVVVGRRNETRNVMDQSDNSVRWSAKPDASWH